MAVFAHLENTPWKRQNVIIYSGIDQIRSGCRGLNVLQNFQGGRLCEIRFIFDTPKPCQKPTAGVLYERSRFYHNRRFYGGDGWSACVDSGDLRDLGGDQADPVCLEKKQGANDSAVPEGHQIGIQDASLVRGRPDRVGTTVRL